MSGTIDWGTVTNIVFGVAAVVLLLAPFFWWLYDTDGLIKLAVRYQNAPIIAALILNAAQMMAKHDWFWLAIYLAALAVIIWRLYRSHEPKPDDSLG